jgi:Flp pilus assembly pilin Flp
MDFAPLKKEISETKKEIDKMKLLTRSYARVNELRRKWSQGQTMTEYALIMAAIAVVVFGVYQTMGTDIQTLVTSVNTMLLGAAS